MTKRQAILLLFSGVISKMAHADENGNVPRWQILSPTKTGITLNLDSFTGVTATMGGESVTVTSEELFKALKSDD